MLPTPLFLDCDTGIDDSLALLYLLTRPDVEITGIASTAGNVATAQTLYRAIQAKSIRDEVLRDHPRLAND